MHLQLFGSFALVNYQIKRDTFTEIVHSLLGVSVVEFRSVSSNGSDSIQFAIILSWLSHRLVDVCSAVMWP